MWWEQGWEEEAIPLCTAMSAGRIDVTGRYRKHMTPTLFLLLTIVRLSFVLLLYSTKIYIYRHLASSLSVGGRTIGTKYPMLNYKFYWVLFLIEVEGNEGEAP